MRRAALVTVAVMIVAGASMSAHHSHPDFFLDRNVEVEGEIERIQFENPHVLITLRTADETIYKIEWEAARALRATAVTSDTLKAADRIVVTGCPARDPEVHALVALKQVRRARDGWVWSPNWLLNK